METLYIELTHRCNLRCHFCYRDRIEEKDDMPIETCEKILNDAKQIGIKYVRFNGYGENILHKDFIKALKYACDLFEKVDFNTNGLALNDKLCDEILNINLDSIIFSVTGFSTEIYNVFQGSNTKDNIIREKVYNNVITFIRKKNIAGKNIKVFMQYILTDKSKDEILDYIEFWKDKSDDINISYMNSIFDENTIFNKKAFTSSMHKCYKIGNEILIHANGDVSLCCGDCFKGTIIENINKVPLRNIINSDKFEYIQTANDKLQFDEISVTCKKCDEIYENLFYDTACKYSDIKKYINNIKKLKNKKLALFGVNINMTEFLCAFKILENTDDFIIIDNFKKGIYEKKEILKPNREILKNRKIIVFADKKFEDIERYVQSIGLECISFKQLMK